MFIYSIVNLVNNKIYIGSTNNFLKRKYTHLYNLKNNTHSNKHLQTSYDKYGIDKFEISILENCSVDNRKEREIYWIEYYQSYKREVGYNIYQPNEDNFKCSEETIYKLKNSTKCQPIDCYDLNLSFIITYPSIREAAKVANTRCWIITDIVNKNNRKSHKGFTYCYHGEVCDYKPSSKQRNMTAFYKS